MATDIFMKIGDIKGESADKTHPGEIELLSFSWGETNVGSRSATGGGSQAARHSRGSSSCSSSSAM